MRDAERVVWETLQKLDHSWHVFYSARENSGSGYDREVDFVLIRLNRIFYCEVKGGIVHVDQRAGPGVTWAHFTRSGEPIRKRVDPKQLWQAKRQVGESIRQIAGQSPRDLGFREHSVYIFPHTPRYVTQRADLEREYFHYAFEEDIAVLPARLQQIAETGKGRFIDHDRIISIINSLDTMVLREGSGMLPPPAPAAPSTRPYGWELTVPITRRPASPSLEALSPLRIGRRFPWHRYRLTRLWKIAAAAIVLFAVANVFADFDVQRDRINLAFPSNQVPRPAPAIEPQVRQPISKPTAKLANTTLPPFIAPSSAIEVEQAIVRAQDQAIYASWQSDTQKGVVLLLEIDSNGCGRYQITRSDLQLPLHEVVRRCPQPQQ